MVGLGLQINLKTVCRHIDIHMDTCTRARVSITFHTCSSIYFNKLESRSGLNHTAWSRSCCGHATELPPRCRSLLFATNDVRFNELLRCFLWRLPPRWDRRPRIRMKRYARAALTVQRTSKAEATRVARRCAEPIPLACPPLAPKATLPMKAPLVLLSSSAAAAGTKCSARGQWARTPNGSSGSDDHSVHPSRGCATVSPSRESRQLSGLVSSAAAECVSP